MSHSAGVDGCAWSGGLTRSTSLLPPGCQESHQRGVASDITKLADLGKQLLSLLLPLFPSPPELFAKVFRHARLRSLLAFWRALLQPQPFIDQRARGPRLPHDVAHLEPLRAQALHHLKQFHLLLPSLLLPFFLAGIAPLLARLPGYKRTPQRRLFRLNLLPKLSRRHRQMSTLESQLTLHRLLKVLNQMKAIRDLFGGGCTKSSSFRQ